jgi:hypothetical protein
MKNILVVCESLRINGTSSGIVSSTFIKLLHESGYKVTVITENNFDYAVTWLPKDVDVRKFDVPAVQKTFLDKIPKVKAIPTYLTGFSKSFRNTVEQYKIQINKELVNQEFDFIYGLGSGSAFAPHFALAEMNLNIPYYLNIHDPFPMHLYPEPYKSAKTWINSILEKKFRIALEKSSGISFPSKLLMEQMAMTFTVINKKGFVIPHIGTSLANLPILNLESNITLDSSKINILHAGTLLGPRNPYFLLQAIAALNEENILFLEQVAFTFIGTVNKDLIDIIANSNLQNVRFTTIRTSYQNSLDIMMQADALLVIEAIADFSPFLPGKLADIAFAEKPVIDLSPKNSELRRLLGNDYPYQCELNDVNTIKKVLYQFYLDFKNNKIDNNIIVQLKSYVSIETNAKILSRFLN